jgi:uncharacterized protein (DUF2147 family)
MQVRAERVSPARIAAGLIGAVLVMGLAGPSAAADVKDMIGSWRWQSFTIEVRACQGDSVCAKVVGGPKNVGLEIFASKPAAKGGELFAQITHPETRETYNTRFQQKDKDRWQLDGCNGARVCLSGEFVRVK